MADQHKGSYLCGSVAYELAGSFQCFYLCHCSRCQKDTGSAHAANLFAPSSRVTWVQGASQVTNYRHPNSLHAKSFCRVCGSALPVMDEKTGCVVVPAGSLDSPVPIAPTARIFVGSRAHWADDLSDVPGHDTLPEQVVS